MTFNLPVSSTLCFSPLQVFFQCPFGVTIIFHLLLNLFPLFHLSPAELGPHHLTPPRSPELSGIYRREFKENKEPSPKVKRKRSVKISNVALEPVQWQNDSLQIITSASDLKSMDEFLLKKVSHCSIHQRRDP